MTTPDPAGAAADVVQVAAKPIAFIAVLIGSALAVAAIIRRYGESLPLPAYLVEFVTGDDDDAQGDDDDEDDE